MCFVVAYVLLSVDGLASPQRDLASTDKELLQALASDEYLVRTHAHAELLSRAKQYGQNRLAQLAGTYFSTGDPEVQVRLYAILKESRQVRPKPVLGLSFKEEKLKLRDGTQVIAMHVKRLSHGKAAQKGGLMVGDKIVRMGEVDSDVGAQPYVAKEAIATLPVGEKVPFHILRDGKPLVLLVRIEAAPIDDSKEARMEREEKFDEWLEAQNPAR